MQDLGSTAGNQAVSASDLRARAEHNVLLPGRGAEQPGHNERRDLLVRDRSCSVFSDGDGSALERCARRDVRKHVNSFSDAVVWIYRSSQPELRDHSNRGQRSADVQRARIGDHQRHIRANGDADGRHNAPTTRDESTAAMPGRGAAKEATGAALACVALLFLPLRRRNWLAQGRMG